MYGMEFNLNEIYIQSIMTKIPTVIVEGVDDVPVYDSICSDLEFKLNVIAVENIESFEAGCGGVVSAANQLKDINDNKHNPKNWVIGIIDKDVKDFREEIPENNMIFTLNQYSMESHFVCKEIVDRLIPIATRATKELRDSGVSDYLMTRVSEAIDQLYLYSLDALKGAINPEYTSVFKYSYNYGRIKDITIKGEVLLRRQELLEFADSLGLVQCISDLKKISRGKWLLNLFCEELEKSFKSLHEACGSHSIKTCQFCMNEAKEKCLYKIRDGITNNTIKAIAFQNTDVSELDYIRHRLSDLNPLKAVA